MTQHQQTSTSKQHQDKTQQTKALNQKIEQEQKQNENDKQHNQHHQEEPGAKPHKADLNTDTESKQRSQAADSKTVESQHASKDSQSYSASQYDKKTETKEKLK